MYVSITRPIYVYHIGHDIPTGIRRGQPPGLLTHPTAIYFSW